MKNGTVSAIFIENHGVRSTMSEMSKRKRASELQKLRLKG
jgi:hypothetical protein